MTTTCQLEHDGLADTRRGAGYDCHPIVCWCR
jgi:hypothetical protein